MCRMMSPKAVRTCSAALAVLSVLPAEADGHDGHCTAYSIGRGLRKGSTWTSSSPAVRPD